MLNELAKKIYQNNVEKGFYDKPSSTGERLMLVVSELSEALEADRKFDGGRANKELFCSGLVRGDSFEGAFKLNIKNSFEDELADAMIRLLDLVGNQGIDIDWHIEQKLKFNKTREYKHGKKY